MYVLGEKIVTKVDVEVVLAIEIEAIVIVAANVIEERENVIANVTRKETEVTIVAIAREAAIGNAASLLGIPSTKRKKGTAVEMVYHKDRKKIMF